MEQSSVKPIRYPGLQKHQGVNYRPERDDASIQVLIERGVPQRVKQQQAMQPQIIEPVLQHINQQERYQQMWQRYSREVTARNPVKLDLLVGQQAIADGQDLKDVGRMLVVSSPYVKEIERSQGKDKARQYVNQTVRAISQGKHTRRTTQHRELQLE